MHKLSQSETTISHNVQWSSATPLASLRPRLILEWPDIARDDKIWQDMPRCAQISPDMARQPQIWIDTHRYGQVWPDGPDYCIYGVLCACWHFVRVGTCRAPRTPRSTAYTQYFVHVGLFRASGGSQGRPDPLHIRSTLCM